MINTADLAAWLTLEVKDTDLAPKFVPGPRAPEFVHADTVGIVTLLPGAGILMEGSFDQPAFQVELIGRERDQARIEDAFEVLDRALILLDVPADLWGTRVIHAGRVGGGPGASQQDEHQRISYACSYWAMVSL